MTIVKTEIKFAHKGEEIKRLSKKNDKDRLCRTIADIHAITFDDSITESEKLEKIQSLTTMSYW